MSSRNFTDGSVNPAVGASISACLIVKNEELFLPGCLASIRDIADEIILIDTGSEDRTVEIAEEHGCRIFHFPWTGDFSAARNESLARATGDWIFIIDADEELPSGEGEKIRRFTRQDDLQIISISVYNKSHDTGRVSSFLPSIRLFRRSLNLHYHGIVHNRLALPDDVPVTRCDISLYHYGYDLSEQALEAKRARSRGLLEKQLETDPDDVFANFNMAQLLRGMRGTDDDDTCRIIMEHAGRIIANPESRSSGYAGIRLMAQNLMAVALLSLKRYDEAESYCQEALEAKPDYIDPVMTLANIHLATGRLKTAGEMYRRFLDLVNAYRPEKETSEIILHFLDARHIARYGLGRIAEEGGDESEALDCYREIPDKQLPYLDVLLRLGNLYLKTGRIAEAGEMFRRQLEHTPESAAALYGLARSLDLSGDTSVALDYYRGALAQDPGNVFVAFHLGCLLLKSGEIDEALIQLRVIVETERFSPDLVMEAANEVFAAGYFAAAESLYKALLDRCPGHVEAANNLGNCCYRLGQFDRACAYYEQLLDDHGVYYPAYRNLGLAYLQLNRPVPALKALMTYIEKTPEDYPVYRVIGDLLTHTGHLQDAIGCYEVYLRHIPDDTACLLALAEVYFNMGCHEAAVSGYRRVLEMDPENETARRRLGEAARVEVCR